jgi:GT2 family glycosyltransferase
MADKVGIVLVNWRGWHDTIECLESLFKSNYLHYQIIVCDNGSDNNSVEQIIAWANGAELAPVPLPSLHQVVDPTPSAKPIPYRCLARAQVDQGCLETITEPLVIIQNGANIGFGAANNVGMRYALSQRDVRYVWLLNNDTVVGANTLQVMLQTAEQHCGITGAILRYYTEPQRVQVYGGGRFSARTGAVRSITDKPCETLDFINGASMLIDLRVIEQVGLFDEQIFMYFEENDYCIRVQKAGYSLKLAHVDVYHKGAASSGGSGSYWSWLNVYNNKLYVMMKHYSWGIWMAYTAAAWIFVLLHPRTPAERRRAARDALGALFRLVCTGSLPRASNPNLP